MPIHNIINIIMCINKRAAGTLIWPFSKQSLLLLLHTQTQTHSQI